MYAVDFEYDGRYLSEYGFIICNFDSSGIDTVNVGSNITFNKVPLSRGKRFNLVSTQYDECIQSVFCICKNPQLYKNNMEITNDEYRELVRWLNRKKFFNLKFINNESYDGEDCFYKSSFNISKIKIGEILYGLELTMETDKPFGYGQKQTYLWSVSDISKACVILDNSDEIGYIYPENIEIKCLESGNLTIHNSIEDRTTIIKNCESNEIITFDNAFNIKTSRINHEIQDDFNFVYLRISNNYQFNANLITFSIPCQVKIEYYPIIKGVLL